MDIRPTSATLALSAAFGCTLDLGPIDKTTSTNGQTSEPGTTTAPDTSGTTGDTPPTTGDPTTTGVGPITTTGDTDTEGPEPLWCNGFDPKLTGLAVHNNADVALMNGSDLAVECGGQGIIMIPIFPHFGGFMPPNAAVSFDVVLDVEGFNIGPNDHFFESIDHDHQIVCGDQDTYGYYSYAFIPIFPPDAIPNINAIDGKPGHLSLTLHTPDGDVPFEADVILKAQIDMCGFGGFETSDYSTTGDYGTTGT